MVTVSHVAQKLVRDRVFVLEAMSRGIVSFGSLAEQLKPDIEKELGKKVRHHAIVMALRRYAETLKEKGKVSFDYTSEIILKTDICDIAVRRSPTLLDKLKQLYDIVDFSLPTPGCLPVKKLWFGKRGPGHSQLLCDKLFCQSPFC